MKLVKQANNESIINGRVRQKSLGWPPSK